MIEYKKLRILSYIGKSPDKSALSNGLKKLYRCFRLIFPAFFAGWNWHHFYPDGLDGCQGFIGPFPSAFLDK